MKNREVATFGAGCFWCIEAVIQRLKGVERVVSGYAGGLIANPTYYEVCSGRTGHAEVIQVTFDANELSYEELLTIFMTSHDPTTLNRQGADTGTQYRSIILHHSDQQKATAEQVIAALKPVFNDPIVTELKAFEAFYEAEREHQDYYNRNGHNRYCQIVIDPKISKLRHQYADKLKATTIS